MTYREYELFVKDYFEKEVQKSFDNVEIKHQEDLKTVTGREYNIDLSYNFKIAGIEYLTIIECKHWKDSVSRDLILTVKEKANDLGAHKSVLVTTKGFQKGAIEYAKEKGVGLIKITTKREIEVYSNFLGIQVSNILEELEKETQINEEDLLNDSVGIVFPKKRVEEYLKSKYGNRVIEILELYEKIINKDELNINDVNEIRKIPNNWFKEYEKIETCGLPLKLSNQRDIRFINVMFTLIKF